MLTIRDRVEQFKRELKSYDFYKKMVQECNEKLEELATQMDGVSSPIVKDVICENAGDPYRKDSRILELMIEEERVIDERQMYINRILDVDKKLMLISESDDKKAIVKIYIDRENHQSVADELCIDRRTMYRRINATLSKIC